MAKKLVFDRVLFAAVVTLVALGLTMVFSASAAIALERGGGVNPFLVRQGAAAALGLAAMWLTMHLDYRLLRRAPVVYALLGGTIVLLVAALFAPELNGTRRWLLLGPLSFQPSEAAKLVVVLFTAYQIDRQRERQRTWELVAPACLVAALLGALIYLEPDLETALLVGLVALVMLFLAGVPWRFFAVGLATLVPIAVIGIAVQPYRLRRIVAFLEPDRYALDAGFQASQSLIAVGSGGVLGLGLGNSVQKLHFLPHPHSDFIFSIVAEELGLLGSLVVMALFGVVLWRGVRAGLRAPDPFGQHLAWGLTALLVLQAVLHISVALSLVPTAGVPLPFLSAGGSALLATLMACGVVLNVSQHA